MTDWEGVLLNSTAPPGEWMSARVRQLTVPPVPIQPARWCTICGKLEEDTVPKIWVLNSNLWSRSTRTYRTRMENVLMSLSSWSNRAMDWMIMLSTLLTLNLTLALE